MISLNQKIFYTETQQILKKLGQLSPIMVKFQKNFTTEL